MEKGLGIRRNLNLTDQYNLWRFYRGLSHYDTEMLQKGTFTTNGLHFTTNRERAKMYSENGLIMEIMYQVTFNKNDQLAIFNRLHKNRSDFFDIICDRNLIEYIVHGNGERQFFRFRENGKKYLTKHGIIDDEEIIDRLLEGCFINSDF